jgi:hypothetical protein
MEMRSAEQAKAIASRMVAVDRGAIAFCKTGDPQLGEREDAAILDRYGDVPVTREAQRLAKQNATTVLTA